MKSSRLYMAIQWLFFLPIILPICIAFGALRGAVQMIERVANQMMKDIGVENTTSFFSDAR